MPIRLVTLQPNWVSAGGPGIFNADMTPALARHGIGLSFNCPCVNCTAKRASVVDVADRYWATRSFVQFRNPIDGGSPFEANRAMWDRVGETFDTLQLSPSILSDTAKGGCGWHGFIGTNGAAPGEVITV
jgi:hypothetical protein